MITKARAIAALAKLRNRPTSRYSPAALDEELVDAVLDAIRARYGQQQSYSAEAIFQDVIDAIKENK